MGTCKTIRCATLLAIVASALTVAESFRSLRASLTMLAHADTRRSFLFTSAMPSEGKTFCSTNFAVTLSQQKFDHQEGFVLSRINGQWDVRSILKLCPMAEEEALMIFVRLVDRKVIQLT